MVSNPYLKFISVLLLGISISLAANAGSKRIVKWKDKHGVTHYGDKLPLNATGRNNVEMSKQGVVMKRNVKRDNKAEDKSEGALAQQRQDSILLASYTNAKEIDLARDRNLEMDEASLQSLAVQQENVAARVTRSEMKAKPFYLHKKPLPPHLIEELALSKSELSRLDKQFIARKKSMSNTRKRFDEEKLRFIALKQKKGIDRKPTK